MGQCKGLTKSGAKCKRDAGASGFCYIHDPEKVAERSSRKKHDEIANFSQPSQKFSERKGFKQVAKIIQTDGMNKELRNSLWNAFYGNCLAKYQVNSSAVYNNRDISVLFVFLWFNFLKEPLNELPADPHSRIKLLQFIFEKFKWFEVYDFLEYVINYFEDTTFVKRINFILERELSGFRFVGGVFSDVTDEQEIEMLAEATEDADFPAVSTHLRRALSLLSNKNSPDYRNSIKESISAVESMAKIIADTPKASLGDALKALESKGELHPALRQSFLNLYGYTSNADGIRHAMLEEPNLSAADAKFFLLSCTSFINYLKSKI